MKQLSILAPTRCGWSFNGPRRSRHRIERRSFLPVNLISARYQGVTVINPFPPQRFDIVHGYNRIPLGTSKFVIGFESHLPRGYGMEETRYFRWLTRKLASPGCRRIVAISEHARRTFRAVHTSGSLADTLESKLEVRYPNIQIPDAPDALAGDDIGHVRALFVGNHFGRKGGCVAVRLAQIALERSFPLEVGIVSSLQVGGAVWTDPLNESFFERYFQLLELPNVRFHQSLPNAEVLTLLRTSHFCLLPSFSDTFGFSAIEAMANATPVVGTRQSALPEFVAHRSNGILLDLPTTELGDWVHSGSHRRAESWFEQNYADEVERLAQAAFDEISAAVADKQHYRDMRRNARETATALFDAKSAADYWDNLYDEAARKE